MVFHNFSTYTRHYRDLLIDYINKKYYDPSLSEVDYFVYIGREFSSFSATFHFLLLYWSSISGYLIAFLVSWLVHIMGLTTPNVS